MSTWIDNVEESIPNEPSADEQSGDCMLNGGPDSQIAEVNANHMDEPSNEPVIAEAPAAATKPVDERELQAILETLLFVSHEPVTVDRLVAVLGGVAKAEIRQALDALKSDYEKNERGLQISEVAGGFQLGTRPEYAPWIKMLGKTKTSAKLSRSGLESLAIIAYKQPIVRAEIEAIRGVETSGVLRTLLERKLVRIVGRKDVPGRPIMYGTTKFFLQHFGLRDLAELPPLREFKELGESEQAMLPVGDEPLQIGEETSVVDPADADASTLLPISEQLSS
jgi:segregation and condensation protein B